MLACVSVVTPIRRRCRGGGDGEGESLCLARPERPCLCFPSVSVEEDNSRSRYEPMNG